MLKETHSLLKGFERKCEYFIGIDSDGCVFDSMEIKHKECFCPNTIYYWKLQAVSKIAREVWNFVNLYSVNRGLNRFNALIKMMELLAERKEIKLREFEVPDLSPLINWVKKETMLGNPSLEKELDKNDDSVLRTALEWSKKINQDVERMVFGISPFPYFRESLAKINGIADLMVVSQTPLEALVREWKENDIYKFVSFIAGQEHGSKYEHLKYGAKDKYPDNKILMIGDALGDLNSAKENEVLFFPIIPGREIESWEKLHSEGLDIFFRGKYAGEYEEKLIIEFKESLPEKPSWK
jgi:phosphoglycolate phosphatase-like HAD superfamily hydrolase